MKESKLKTALTAVADILYAGILWLLNALMVPYFVIINRLGLYNTYGGMTSGAVKG